MRRRGPVLLVALGLLLLLGSYVWYAQRVVTEESHHGRLVLVASESGAVFDVIVPG